jgi:CheY-like chemotaxis protein
MEAPRPLVLVADDDPAICALLRRLLERAGFRVETAADGAAALARLASGGVSLVLVDLMMPQIDGLEFCRRVRESEQEPRVPIILLTGSVNAADRRAGFALGADDYLLKPFRNQAVLDRVRAWTHTAATAPPQGGNALSPKVAAAKPVPSRGERMLDQQSPLVLVIDDDPTIRDMLSELLRAEGYRVRAIPPGDTALQNPGAPSSAGDEPAIVLMDPGWSDGDRTVGFQQLTALAATVPVVAVSVSPAQLVEAQAAGARATLAKPLDLLQLAGLLDRYCPLSPEQTP